jgi:deoxyribodipyrimidine photolyase-related protein
MERKTNTMTKALRLVLGDQLTHGVNALKDVSPNDTILMAEVMGEATYVPHHPKKIAFLFSAMRHFAQELEELGHHVRYVKLNDPNNTQSITTEVARAVQELNSDEVITTHPGEYRLRQEMQHWASTLKLPVEIRTDERFIATLERFNQWAKGKKQLTMEFFYREMRKETGLLMTPDGKPEGDAWNFDKENRKPLKHFQNATPRLTFKHDATTQDVLALVEDRFSHHFGELLPFDYAVTRKQALEVMNSFLANRLPHFGDYQDAMLKGEPFLYHSILSPYLNAGLLSPLDVCHAAEACFHKGVAPLNAVEGFIRQILGWREFVRGIYWHLMPEYGERNTLNATRDLPSFYWGKPTHMACVAEAVAHTQQHAYSHHIHRLMITGNFALLAGLDVVQVQAWYLAVYVDAYEWVEMPNTLGMALHGDGGVVGTKPYIASGSYINRMSNYCKGCHYDVKIRTGQGACPFNTLYWDFLIRHKEAFSKNTRMALAYKNLDKITPDEQAEISMQAAYVLANLDKA